jgi:hypothetical protein
LRFLLRSQDDGNQWNMDSWSIALWVVAGYFAAVALLRLMAHKRSEVMDEFRGEVAKEKSRRKAAAAKKASQSHGKAA